MSSAVSMSISLENRRIADTIFPKWLLYNVSAACCSLSIAYLPNIFNSHERAHFDGHIASLHQWAGLRNRNRILQISCFYKNKTAYTLLRLNKWSVRKHMVFAYIDTFDMQRVTRYIIVILHQRFHPFIHFSYPVITLFLAPFL